MAALIVFLLGVVVLVVTSPALWVTSIPEGTERLRPRTAYRDQDGRFCMVVEQQKNRAFCWFAEEWMEDPK
jgi:hypothetical protein